MMPLFHGCMMSVNIGKMTTIYQSLEPVREEQVELYFTDMPSKEAVVIGKMELIGDSYAHLKKEARKQAGKVGADAVVVMAQVEGSSDYFYLGQKMSSTYLGTKGNKSYYMVNYKSPTPSNISYARWLVYAVSYKVDNVDLSELPQTLFDYDKVALFESVKVQLTFAKGTGV